MHHNYGLQLTLKGPFSYTYFFCIYYFTEYTVLLMIQYFNLRNLLTIYKLHTELSDTDLGQFNKQYL